MKIRLAEFRSIIREALLLLESTCPLCGSEGAYVGLNTVECPNPGCDRYDPKMDPAMSGQPGPHGKTVHLSEDELSALKASMDQGLLFDEHPEWQEFYDDVYTKLNSKHTKYPVTVEVPVSPEWDDNIIGAIESEVMSDDPDQSSNINASSGNDYGIEPDDLIYKVTSEQR